MDCFCSSVYVTELVLALDRREGIRIVKAYSCFPQRKIFLVFNINLYFTIPITIFYESNKNNNKVTFNKFKNSQMSPTFTSSCKNVFNVFYMKTVNY